MGVGGCWKARGPQGSLGALGRGFWVVMSFAVSGALQCPGHPQQQPERSEGRHGHTPWRSSLSPGWQGAWPFPGVSPSGPGHAHSFRVPGGGAAGPTSGDDAGLQDSDLCTLRSIHSASLGSPAPDTWCVPPHTLARASQRPETLFVLSPQCRSAVPRGPGHAVNGGSLRVVPQGRVEPSLARTAHTGARPGPGQDAGSMLGWELHPCFP